MFLYKSNNVPVLDHMRGPHRTTPGLLYPMHGVSWAFPTVSYLCLREGLEALDFMMSHFLAVSLRTRVLPVCLLGLGPALGGGLLLLPVLPVSQGPGEADWGLSLVAVLPCWGEVMSRFLDVKLAGCPRSFRLAPLGQFKSTEPSSPAYVDTLYPCVPGHLQPSVCGYIVSYPCVPGHLPTCSSFLR